MPPRGANSTNSTNSAHGTNSVNNGTENTTNTSAARQARKRRAGMAPKMRANKTARTQMSVEDVSDLEKLLKTLEECADDDNRGVWLTLELALNRCTFEHSLRSMFADEQGQSAMPQHVPVVPRAYEESFMHEHDPASSRASWATSANACSLTRTTALLRRSSFFLTCRCVLSKSLCV